MQLRLPFRRDELMLQEYLRKKSGRKLSLAITENSTVMMSMRTTNGVVYLRLQSAFLDAGDDILDEIAAFAKKGKGSTPLLRQFINRSPLSFPRSPVPRANRTAGKHHDLSPLFEAVNIEYFGGAIKAGITWGKRTRKRNVRRRTLGSYSPSTDTIRINPVLDRKDVPLLFLKFILYHEMLHSEIGVVNRNGRRSVHNAEFRRREKIFRGYEEAIAWEKEGL